jgi:Lrp/AsnC family leucine-responsive transcriptional regulator
VDRIDVQLATALSHNGRATFQELGALVRLSANTVADRVRRLQREGVIAGFSAVIDERALGKKLASCPISSCAKGSNGSRSPSR